MCHLSKPKLFWLVTLLPGSDLPGGGGWGLTLPMIFLTPRVSFDLSSWGSILTPVLVLHVSACGASTLSPVGDPPNVFFYKSDTVYYLPSLLSFRALNGITNHPRDGLPSCQCSTFSAIPFRLECENSVWVLHRAPLLVSSSGEYDCKISQWTFQKWYWFAALKMYIFHSKFKDLNLFWITQLYNFYFFIQIVKCIRRNCME